MYIIDKLKGRYIAVDYLFFDIECANCDDNRGKICSFGYVLADSKLNVLMKEDIVINPDAPFRCGKDFHFAYKKPVFLQAEKYPVHYPKIRELLEAKNRVVIGYSVMNDIKFLIGESQRYSLPSPEFVFYDTQLLYKYVMDCKNPPSLTKIAEELGCELLSAHKSDDDALMTLAITQKLAERMNTDVERLLADNFKSRGSVKNFAAEREDFSVRRALKGYFHVLRVEKPVADDYFKCRTFWFDKPIEERMPSRLASLLGEIKTRRGGYTTRAFNADVMVYDQIPESVKAAGKPKELITLDSLLKRLNITADGLPSVELKGYENAALPGERPTDSERKREARRR